MAEFRSQLSKLRAKHSVFSSAMPVEDGLGIDKAIAKQHAKLVIDMGW